MEADLEAALAQHTAERDARPINAEKDQTSWNDDDWHAYFLNVLDSGISAPRSVGNGIRAPPEVKPHIEVGYSEALGLHTLPPGDRSGGEAPADGAKRNLRGKTRVRQAMRNFADAAPGYRAADDVVGRLNSLFDAVVATGSAQRKIEAAHAALIEGIRIREDFHLTHLEVIADQIERCGQPGASACKSYWCPVCRKRFGAQLLEDTQAQLRPRYGKDLERARSQLVYLTLLNDVVIPEPEFDADYLANFLASIVRYDHRDILRYLKRWQSDWLSAMKARLSKLGLTLALAEDWIGLSDRDRRFYSADNLVTDAVRLVAWNAEIAEARRHFQRQRTRPDLETKETISCRDTARYEAYLWQLRKARPLDREDVYHLASGFQSIYREFSGITKTNFPERLKFKSSIEKVIKRERNKFYRLSRDLPDVSAIGMVELELIDLRHTIGGDHQHRVKSKTVRVLASQQRKPMKPRKTDEPLSFEAQRLRLKRDAQRRRLDEARDRIATNQDLPEDRFPNLQYAILVHMHIVVDLNGTPRADFERWLTGRGESSRQFGGFWTLPYQVMVKGLFENKPVEDSLRHISFYPFKGPLSFNYENTAPGRDEGSGEGDATSFDDEALALIAWLQHGIGHERLRIGINWPGADREKRGRKPTKTVVPKMTEEEFEEAVGSILDAHGLDRPRKELGQTDIGDLFEEGAQVAGDESTMVEATKEEDDED